MDQIKTGKFISSLRKEKGLTQEKLGEQLGVTNKTVSRWETGVYMPDIDTLKLLSELFSVSINELLSGERLNDSEFRSEADKNIVSVTETSLFTVKEKIDYRKKKWIKEHRALTATVAVLCMAILIFAVIKSVVWLAGAAPLIWFATYAFLRNRMMIYVENSVYGKSQRTTESDR